MEVKREESNSDKEWIWPVEFPQSIIISAVDFGSHIHFGISNIRFLRGSHVEPSSPCMITDRNGSANKNYGHNLTFKDIFNVQSDIDITSEHKMTERCIAATE